ncbi:MAG TPA: hypothetical protein VMS08_01400, partial [Candidatus Saccharimonadia bacterium]|nr:hypothetical protein [Candidatus Saccharimonadia bacterium]
MAINDTKQLEAELQQSGASAREAKELSKIARSLHHLSSQEPQLSHETYSTIPKQPIRFRTRRAFAIGLVAAGSITMGLAIASIAQTTLPGTFLYPVKQLTENVAVSIQPSYRGTLMMRRAEEVKQLVALHQSP